MHDNVPTGWATKVNLTDKPKSNSTTSSHGKTTTPQHHVNSTTTNKHGNMTTVTQRPNVAATLSIIHALFTALLLVALCKIM